MRTFKVDMVPVKTDGGCAKMTFEIRASDRQEAQKLALAYVKGMGFDYRLHDGERAKVTR